MSRMSQQVAVVFHVVSCCASLELVDCLSPVSMNLEIWIFTGLSLLHDILTRLPDDEFDWTVPSHQAKPLT